MSQIKKGFNEYQVVGDRTIIYLENRNKDVYETIIDTKNLKKLIDVNYHWHLIWEKNIQAYYVKTHIYEISNGKRQGKSIYLAKFLMNCPKKMKVDHINHNTLWNLESNLRIVTYAKNSKNRKSANKNNKAGYRNVCMIDGWYRVQLQINGKGVCLPKKFEHPSDAGKYAKKMRKKHYGD
jgi:hypothetical protein